GGGAGGERNQPLRLGPGCPVPRAAGTGLADGGCVGTRQARSWWWEYRSKPKTAPTLSRTRPATGIYGRSTWTSPFLGFQLRRAVLRGSPEFGDSRSDPRRPSRSRTPQRDAVRAPSRREPPRVRIDRSPPSPAHPAAPRERSRPPFP